MSGALSRSALPDIDPRYRPTLDPGQLTTGIVHLGIGAFHRAHQAVYVEDAAAAEGATDWGITGVSQRSPRVRDTLAPQDFLYSVLSRDADSAELRVMASLREVLFAGADPDAVVDRLAAPETRIVSLTVTEKGYHANLATGRLELDDEIRGDLDGGTPATAIGQLVRSFQRRRETGAGPVTVLPCDNVPANGRTLGGVVVEFCERLPGGADGLVSWIADNVSFASTMVDRIVPATDERTVAEVERRLGLRDAAALLTEPFTQWVVEDRFLAGRPAWERVGVTFTDDVTPYEMMKLRLVNASNSALAYLGLLSGRRHISDAVEMPDLAAFADRLMREEMAPTLQVPDGVDLDAYCSQILERFANPWLLHRTRQVAMDGSQKLPQRVVRPIAEHRAAGREPVLAALTLAAWMQYVRQAAGAGGDEELQDALADDLRRAVSAAGDSDERLVSELLGQRRMFPEDLAGDTWLRDTLTAQVSELARSGPAACVSTVLGR